jgi:hypothetical protein
MTTGGWINMIVSVGLVTFLFGWCIYRVVFGKPKATRLHGMDIDTRDTDGKSRRRGPTRP